MKFSIVMPVLNGARFIESAIASVKAQSHADWELLVMDGGSEDGSADKALALAAGDARISVMIEPDRGLYDAVLKGVARASGAWLGWLNSDDLLAPWALASVARHVEKTGAQWVTGCPGAWDEEGRLRYARPSGLYPQGLIRAGWFHPGLLGCLQQESIFLSRALFERLAPEDVERVRSMRYAGDYLLWRLLAAEAPIEFIPTLLGGFRKHGDNLSAKNSDAYAREVAQTAPANAPRLLAGAIALAYRTASSWAMVKAAARADLALDAEIKSSPSPTEKKPDD